MLAYHDTVRVVRDWVDKANDAGTPTMLISVSDHETGGLSLGRQLTSEYPEYLCESSVPPTVIWPWLSFVLAGYPDALANATHSSSYLGNLITNTSSVTRTWLREQVFEAGLGITDVTDGEINALWPYRYDAYRANRVLADAVSGIDHLAIDSRV